jgi:GT2 family glycosyltransferase
MDKTAQSAATWESHATRDEGSTLLTIAMPTLNRGPVLVDTIRHLMALGPPADEILVLDQTRQHEEDIEEVLYAWERQGKIRWVRLSAPSITIAMNHGLIAASGEHILFLDDDIVPEPRLVAAHLEALSRSGVGLVAGRVVQPWEEGKLPSQTRFHFAQNRPAWIGEFMGGNFSIRRELALAIGGFDENFVHVGYRFEAEFAHRLRKEHYRIYFEPAACIHHLKATSGGTRTFGDHLRSYWPSHSVGAYYYHLRTWSGWPSLVALLSRFPRAIANRHHLQRPWWIPATAVAEFSGMIWALWLAVRGPRYISTRQKVEPK